MLKLPRAKKVRLASGATLLYQRNPVSPTVAFGVWITRGSRDEKPRERGFSHLLEHMVFRGTGRRGALEIALDLESIGGHWDAFTDKETTCYHGKVLEEHFPKLVDIFADIILYPSFPRAALETERKIVREEIRSVNDSPEECTYELFYRTLFPEDQLGYPVAGMLSDLDGCTRRRLVAFHRRCYTAGNTIFGFIGNLPVGEVASMLDRKFKFSVRAGDRSRGVVSREVSRIRSIRRNDWNQSHVCIGTRIPSPSSSDRFPLLMLSGALGGGVSSRLFQSLRESAGLAYSVFSHAGFWKDTGALTAFFSVDPKNLREALGIFRDVLDELRRNGIREEELESVKSQMKGSVVFGAENVDSRLFRLFSSEFYHGRFRTVHSIIREIEKVGLRRVQSVAREYLSFDRLTFVTCGPVTLRELDVKRLLRREDRSEKRKVR